jgi:hypothetical protein
MRRIQQIGKRSGGAGQGEGRRQLDRGYCMMIGGDVDVVKHLDPIFATLAPRRGNIPRTPAVRSAPWRPTSAPNTAAAGGPATLPCGPIGPSARHIPEKRSDRGAQSQEWEANVSRKPTAPRWPGSRHRRSTSVRDSDHPDPPTTRNVSGSAVANRDPPHVQILPKSRQTIRHGAPPSSPEPIGRAHMIRHHGSYVTSRSSSPMT